MFVKLNNIWYQYCPDREGKYKYISFDLRTPEIEPTVDELSVADKSMLETWHGLYIEKGYCPLRADVSDNDIWVSPCGDYYIGTGHGP